MDASSETDKTSDKTQMKGMKSFQEGKTWRKCAQRQEARGKLTGERK